MKVKNNYTSTTDILKNKKGLSYIQWCLVMLALIIIVSFVLSYVMSINVVTSQKKVAQIVLDEYVDKNAIKIYSEVKENGNFTAELRSDELINSLDAASDLTLEGDNYISYTDSKHIRYILSDIKLQFIEDFTPQIRLDYNITVPLEFYGNRVSWIKIPITLESRFVPKFESDPNDDGVNSAPKLTILTPSGTTEDTPAHSLTDTFVISGKAVDEDGVSFVTVNGIPAILNDDGTWEAEAQLSMYHNTFKVVALDGTGRSSSETVYLYRKGHSNFSSLGNTGSATPTKLDAADFEKGGYFVLESDIELSRTVLLRSISESKHLHICLNGHTITCPTDAIMFYIGGAENGYYSLPQSLTICDCSEEQTGKLDQTSVHNTSQCGIVNLSAYGTFNFYSGTITGLNTTGERGGGVRQNSWSSTFNMYGGTITGNTAKNGAGLYLQRGIFNMFGGEIKGNTATQNGGGIYIAQFNDSLANIKGGSISENTAVNAGGVWINKGKLVLDGGKISNNTGTSNYGGVYAAGYTSAEILSGEISGNSTNGSGGGLALGEKADISVKGGKISNNTAKNGGAFWINKGGTLLISDGEITGNKATTNGSILLTNQSELTITGGLFTENISADKAITASGSEILVSGGVFENNTKTGGTTLSQIEINNYLAASNALFTEDAVVRNPVTIHAARADGTPAGVASVGKLNEGAEIMGSNNLTIIDSTVSKVKDGSYYRYVFMIPKNISGTISTLTPGSYKLTGDTELSKSITLTAGQYTIDLNGYTLTGKTVPYFDIPAGVTLDLKSSSDNKGKIQGLETASRAIISVSGGSLTLKNVSLTGNNVTSSATAARGSALRITNGGTVHMISGSIYNNNSKAWGTVFVEGSTSSFKMTGGMIYNNTANRGGGIAVNNDASLLLQGGQIGVAGYPNTATYGGGVYANATTVELDGTEISYNHAKTQGGGIYFNGTVNMHSGLISSNTATSGGSAMFAAGSTLNMSGGIIRGTDKDKDRVILRTSSAGVQSKANFTGNPILEDVVVEATTISLKSLTKGASVLFTAKANEWDLTAMYSMDGSLYHYEYDYSSADAALEGKAQYPYTASSYIGKFDGGAHGITVDATGATILYSKNQEGPYSGINPMYTEVGTYTTWYKVIKDGYLTTTGSATVTILENN